MLYTQMPLEFFVTIKHFFLHMGLGIGWMEAFDSCN
jgi:hypothetical protein